MKRYRGAMHPMRVISLLAMCALLIAAPVSAQTGTPVPSTSGSIVRELTDSAQTMGATAFVLIVVVMIQGGIVFFLISVAQRGMSPLLGTLKALNDSRQDVQREFSDHVKRGDAERQKTAEITERAAAANERTATILSDLETKREAVSGRRSAVQEITEHVDAAAKTLKESDEKQQTETRTSLKTLTEKIDGLIELLQKTLQSGAAREETAAKTLENVARELSGIRVVAQKIEATTVSLSETDLKPTAAVTNGIETKG